MKDQMPHNDSCMKSVNPSKFVDLYKDLKEMKCEKIGCTNTHRFSLSIDDTGFVCIDNFINVKDRCTALADKRLKFFKEYR